MDQIDLESVYLELSYCEDYFRDLIQLYNDYLSLNINMYLFNKRQVHTQSSSGKFCMMIKERHPKLCEMINREDFDYPICKAGMICHHFPINISDRPVGSLFIGQKVIKGKEALSKNMLINSLNEVGANPTEVEYFCSLFDKLELIDEKDIDELINKINFIKRHFYTEFNRSYYTEKRVSDLKRLAENLAHQLITPIQGIMGEAENLIGSIDGLPLRSQDIEIKEMANDIFIEIQKLSLLADNLRNWIISEHDWVYKYDFKMRPILPIILHAKKLFRNEAKSRGILINDPIFEIIAPPELRISSEHMTRVFYNLMSNAVKYSYDGTSNNFRWIETRCRPDGKYYCIEITNYGVGILPEELDSKIYKLGYRGKLAKDRSRYGSGLGLQVVEKIIKDHGGKIEITSEPQGNRYYGDNNPFKTTIGIYLPFGKEEVDFRERK